MRIETLRLAFDALEGEYGRFVGYAKDAMDDALKAESRGDDEAERTMRAVSAYWDNRATEALTALQEVQAALDEAEKEVRE